MAGKSRDKKKDSPQDSTNPANNTVPEAAPAEEIPDPSVETPHVVPFPEQLPVVEESLDSTLDNIELTSEVVPVQEIANTLENILISDVQDINKGLEPLSIDQTVETTDETTKNITKDLPKTPVDDTDPKSLDENQETYEISKRPLESTLDKMELTPEVVPVQEIANMQISDVQDINKGLKQLSIDQTVETTDQTAENITDGLPKPPVDDTNPKSRDENQETHEISKRALESTLDNMELNPEIVPVEEIANTLENMQMSDAQNINKRLEQLSIDQTVETTDEAAEPTTEGLPKPPVEDIDPKSLDENQEKYEISKRPLNSTLDKMELTSEVVPVQEIDNTLENMLISAVQDINKELEQLSIDQTVETTDETAKNSNEGLPKPPVEDIDPKSLDENQETHEITMRPLDSTLDKMELTPEVVPVQEIANMQISDVQDINKGLKQLSIDQTVKTTDETAENTTAGLPKPPVDENRETRETSKRPRLELTSEEPTVINEPSSSTKESPEIRVKKHVFGNPDSYVEFTPKRFTIQLDDSSSSESSVRVSRPLPTLRDHPPHSFLATIDTVLMILECTLAGAYRISQKCSGPTIPLVVANTMQSIRLALETLKVHFGYTRQQNFEPIASILRELLIPAVELFSYICPELKFPDVQYYRSIDEGVELELPNPAEEEMEYLMKPQQLAGMVYFQPHPIPIPKGPPRIALFMDDNRDPNLGAFATADGFIRLQLPYTFQIDLTIDEAICVRNLRDKTIACISACGNFSALSTTMARVHQHNLVSEIRINDEFDRRNMFAKMGVRGIQFGGTGCPQNAHLKDDGTLSTTDAIFEDLHPEYIKQVFINRSTNGPEQYEACCAALKDCTTKTLTDGSLHFYWKDIKITQYSNGEVTVARNHWNFMIWCAPEILHIKKGVVKITTPVGRMVTTIINTPELHKEKYFLANLGQMWVYYTARDYIVSNEVYSAGYNNENNSEDCLLDEAAGYQE